MLERIFHRILNASSILLKNSKKLFFSNICLVVGLIFPLLFMYHAFGAAGRLSGNYEAKINEVRSLGDPRIFFPFTYMYAVSISIALLISKNWKCRPAIKARKYFTFISKVAYEGILFFIALMTAQVIYFGTAGLATYLMLLLFIVLPSAIISAISGYEHKSENYLSRSIAGLLILSSSIPLLIEVAKVIS